MTATLGRHAAQRDVKRADPLHLDAQSRVRVAVD